MKKTQKHKEDSFFNKRKELFLRNIKKEMVALASYSKKADKRNTVSNCFILIAMEIFLSKY